jgi:hypothetical protein
MINVIIVVDGYQNHKEVALVWVVMQIVPVHFVIDVYKVLVVVPQIGGFVLIQVGVFKIE